MTRTTYNNGHPVTLNNCDGCSPATINGVFCHETGCPEAWRDYTAECSVCEEDFYRDDRDETVCEDCRNRDPADYSILLVDGCHGVYVPERFANNYTMADWNVSEENAAILAIDDHEYYWEVWDEVLNSAAFTDRHGHTWHLWQDGDLFAVRDDCPDEFYPGC